MQTGRIRANGFTQLELLAVVGIVSILAAVAVFAYGRYQKKASSSEVYAMIASIKQAEESYKSESGMYLSTSSDEADFYPQVGAHGKEPVKKSFDQDSKPMWKPLGVKAPGKYLYCGYVVIAGQAGDLSTAGARGVTLFGGNAPKVPWYYVRATCDLDGDPAANSTYETTFDRQTVYVDNEGK